MYCNNLSDNLLPKVEPAECVRLVWLLLWTHEWKEVPIQSCMYSRVLHLCFLSFIRLLFDLITWTQHLSQNVFCLLFSATSMCRVSPVNPIAYLYNSIVTIAFCKCFSKTGSQEYTIIVIIMMMMMMIMMMNVKDKGKICVLKLRCLVLLRCQLLKVKDGENNLSWKDVTFKSFVIGELYIFIILKKN